MELVHPLEPTGEESPLARARLHRQLTVEETARRAGITAEEVRWLEEGRVYRFPRPDDALIATALYATALGLDNREARELAGLPVPPQAIERNPLPRLLVAGGVVVVETLFAYPGIGQLAFESLIARDYPVLQAVFLVTGLAVIATNAVADLVLPRLDPRLSTPAVA